ncbi:MAG TPA: hypothetical protein VI752_00720 [Candidatus Paceibacterota bacterium]|nr:hypothetical protein [Patescibacteria group bacterium]
MTPTIAEGPLETGPEAQIEATQTVSNTELKQLDKNQVNFSDLITEKAINQGVNAKLANSIAFCESTYRQFENTGEALRGNQNRLDVGLFQINEKYHLEKSQELGFDIHTTEGNIDYALWLIKNEGEQHWKWSQHCWGPKVS